MRRVLIAFVALVSWPSVPDAAFSQPSSSPVLAASGETLASEAFTAGMILHVPAAVCLSRGVNIELAGQRLYALPELDSYVAAATARHRRWGAGAAFLSMGDADFYLETTFTACLGYEMASFLYAGASAGYSRIEMADRYGNVGSPSFSCGVVLIPSGDWMAYASIKNPFEPGIFDGTKLHRELNGGIAVTSIDNVGFAVEINIRSGNEFRLKIGEVFRLSPVLSVAAGMMTSPFVPSFGCRFTWKHFDLLYAYRYHPELGGTHIWGISFSR